MVAVGGPDHELPVARNDGGQDELCDTRHDETLDAKRFSLIASQSFYILCDCLLGVYLMHTVNHNFFTTPEA